MLQLEPECVGWVGGYVATWASVYVCCNLSQCMCVATWANGCVCVATWVSVCMLHLRPVCVLECEPVCVCVLQLEPKYVATRANVCCNMNQCVCVAMWASVYVCVGGVHVCSYMSRFVCVYVTDCNLSQYMCVMLQVESLCVCVRAYVCTLCQCMPVFFAHIPRCTEAYRYRRTDFLLNENGEQTRAPPKF